ncbi:MAG: peptidylprolyl isomerase [Alphaproteobacteria bacterium]|nr:peptidylprolyl isomerase [Alphaproteobacteria bacterium]MBV9692285.1 peptidylprolyl isomerase [Alphaproteobacteria bacterium]
MRRLVLLAAGLCLLSLPAAAQEVRFETSLGAFSVKLDPAHAPKTVANFLRYVREKHFDGTVVYRVVPDFVIQMGSYSADGSARSTHDPIPLESSSGLKNLRGTVAMARSGEPASGTAEFFVNLSDNDSLDPRPGAPPNATGYAVFGKVVEGMSVVDAIAAVQLGGAKGPFPPDATPLLPVTIVKATVSAP